MFRKGVLLCCCLMILFRVLGQEKMSRPAYIEMYAELAMKEMSRTGIPASITLAQGCLESDNGNSRLAVNANNHFGIKCHDWTGRKVYHDDDEKNECFRKYRDVYQSYIDHSEFLLGKPRYAELFELKPDDYKRWATGLQKSGYATSRQYASLLIRIIEDNQLYRYDQMVLEGGRMPEDFNRGTMEMKPSREVLTNNRIEYVISRHGDTPESLRDEMDMYPWEICRYNDINRGAVLDSGMVIYLQPKRRRAEKGNETHLLEEGQTLKDVSQLYGVKLKMLYRYNDIDRETGAEPGTRIWLRRKMPSDKEALPRKRTREEERDDEPAEMEFEF